MRGVILAVALLAGTAIAQPPAAVPPAGVAAPLDPARIAAARPVIAKLWPSGTYQRMMDSVMTTAMQTTMSNMYGMKAADMAGLAGDKADTVRKAVGDRTVGEVVEAADPAFRERMRLTTEVMSREMIALIVKVEPSVQEALVRAYARAFTVAQLDELTRFFATPTGGDYAARSMMLYADPEMMAAMQVFVPEMMRAMPGILAKVQAATAHLPPPPARAGAVETK